MAVESPSGRSGVPSARHTSSRATTRTGLSECRMQLALLVLLRPIRAVVRQLLTRPMADRRRVAGPLGRRFGLSPGCRAVGRTARSDARVGTVDVGGAQRAGSQPEALPVVRRQPIDRLLLAIPERRGARAGRDSTLLWASVLLQRL